MSLLYFKSLRSLVQTLSQRAVMALAMVPLALLQAAPSAALKRVDFNQEIRPLLAEYCYQCHGPDLAKRKGGLRLDQQTGAMARLDSGVRAIVAGKPTESRLLQVISSQDPEEHMPPIKTGKQMKPAQVALLTRWISEGADWKAHWSYISPEIPPRPAVQKKGWGRNEIDRFVQLSHEKNGLKSAPEADRRTLARRVTLDLTGLPPTVEEVDAFLADRNGTAYEALVDRLLASEAYGERMAVPWLDLARFADSDGYHNDAARSMWQYRDWVIRAFNANQPFDQFIIDQLAGDLLPNATLDQKVATAFNRNGMSSTEGGADPDEYLNKYVTDRVNTFGTVFLGSSIQCAECHNHKYDPFTQREYYQLYDFFNRIPERGLDSDPAPPFLKVPTLAQATELITAIAAAKTLTAEHQNSLDAANPTWEAAQTAWELGFGLGADGTNALQIGPWFMAGPFLVPDGKGAYSRDFGPENGFNANAKFSDGKIAWTVQKTWKDGAIQGLDSAVGATYLHRTISSDQVRTQVFYFGSDDGLRVWFNGKEVLAKDLTRGVAANQDEVRVSLKAGENHLLLKVINLGGSCGFYFATDRDAADPKILSLRELARRASGQRTKEQSTQLRHHYRETRVPEVIDLALRSTVARKREADGDRAIPTLRVMEEMAKPRPSHIRIRGDYRAKGELVTADVPTSCLPPARFGPATNRLDLARWVVDPSNPLTARVAVNRFWGLFFPNSIVRTGNEFGTNGEPPTHPELLDWLARRFVEDRWDVKAMMKRIVTSATYRQSSHVSAQLVAQDPDNHLLARGPRFRMPAEMLRDNALAVSGLLIRRLGGPSVRPYQPPGLWEEKMFGGNKYEVGKGDELYRRSLYTLWKRTVPNPTLQTFDAPDRALCTVQRSSTCTPLQAFVTMNDVTFLEAARVFAQKVLRDVPTGTPQARIQLAFQTVLARQATPKELKSLTRLVSDLQASYTADTKAAEAMTRIGQSPRLEKVRPAELAAWTGLASVVLNLDEAVTRE